MADKWPSAGANAGGVRVYHLDFFAFYCRQSLDTDKSFRDDTIHQADVLSAEQ